jgi:hypothetical protein
MPAWLHLTTKLPVCATLLRVRRHTGNDTYVISILFYHCSVLVQSSGLDKIG